MKTKLLLPTLACLLLTVALAQTNPPATVVDLLVVYTPQALNDAGGEARIHAEIDTVVAEANRCFSNSQVNARFNLVHRSVVSYTESGDPDTDLTRLRNMGDGYLDDVHRLRNLYKADLVMLYTFGTDGSPGAGFCIVGRQQVLTRRWLPTYMLAQTLGPVHRKTPTSDSERLANRFTANGILYHTIASFDPGISVPYWSGTNVLYQGVPTGTTAADNDVKLMNQNAPAIARFRVATNRFEFAAARYSVAENLGTAKVEVLRIGDTNTAASVDVHVTPGTAQPGTDFIAQTNRLTFSPGVEVLVCLVTVLDNAICMGERTVKLSLQPPEADATYTAARGNAPGLQDTAELVIQEDDSGFVLDAAHCVVSESSAVVTLKLRRLGDVSQPGAVSFVTRDGTALAGVHYVATNGALTFAVGEAERLVTIPVLNDPVPGDDRSFSVALINPGPGTGLGDPNLVEITLLDQQRPGSLDAAFNPVGGPNRPVLAMAVRSDGRLLCGGGFTQFNGADHAGLVQLNPDGSVDSSFHPVRIAVGPDREDGGVYGSVWAIAEQSDGRILVGGEFPAVNGVNRPNLARFNTNGTLDPDFLPAAPNGRVQCILFQPDGKILLGGVFTTIGGQWHPMVARLNPDGSLDPDFRFSISGFVDLIPLGLQPDGKILVGYVLASFFGACTRLNPDGTRDSSFRQPAFPFYSWPNALTVLPNGQILMGGDFRTVNGKPRPLLARLNSDGTLDESFITPFDRNGYATSLIPLPDGRLLVAGLLNLTNTPARRNLVRLNADGSLDPSFDVGSGPNDFVFAVAAHASGSVYFGGAFVEVNGRSAPYLARVRCDGTGPRLEAPVWAESGVNVTLHGLPGTYSLETSPDLHAWLPLATVTNFTGQAEYVDVPLVGQTARFYRAAVK
ncbi:MAG TPA: Calx-beta domain-containing protein [Candidatus Paceibacterota bacterium]|nr:Calx-beta domain-containing protein [Candidatus Paceibacterota bacterium]